MEGKSVKGSSAKVTIVTVCYNAEKTIETTILSVMRQTYRPVEYIVIDGLSSDRTFETVKKYQEKMVKSGIEYKILSEPDSGIYNAMNKGVHMATGEWIAFMNADDRYYSESSIEKMLSKWDGQSSVLYGNEIVTNGKEKRKNKRNSDIAQIKKGLPFCHQSALTRTDLMQKYGYDERFKIAADYGCYLKMYFADEKFQYVDADIAQYYEDGVSARNYKSAVKEVYRLKVEYGIWKRTPYFWLKKEAWILIIGLRRWFQHGLKQNAGG